MRRPLLDRVEDARITKGPRATTRGDTWGEFSLKLKVQQPPMHVILSDGFGWDHVSASYKNRCPTWEEMSMLKDLFFDEEEAVMQIHVPKSHHVNNHPYCLHLWRPQEIDIPLPPDIMVGVRDAGILNPRTARQINRAVKRAAQLLTDGF